VAHGIAEPGLFDLLVMRPAVEEYFAPNMRAAFVNDEEAVGV
jgi:hypothetical protein